MISDSLRLEILAALSQGSHEQTAVAVDRLRRLAVELSDQVDTLDDFATKYPYPAWFLLRKPKSTTMEVLTTPVEPEEFAEWEDFLPAEYLLQGRIDERSLIYILGMLGFKFLCGTEVPYKGSSVYETLKKRISGDSPEIKTLRPDCDPRLVTLLRKCMSAKAEARIQSVGEFISELDCVNSGV